MQGLVLASLSECAQQFSTGLDRNSARDELSCRYSDSIPAKVTTPFLIFIVLLTLVLPKCPVLTIVHFMMPKILLII